MPPPDPELFRWFTEEAQPHETALRAWLGRRFPELRDVDDVVQESYARLMQARRSGAIASPRGFLFVAARNLALNHLRHLRYEPICEREAVEMVFDETPPIFESVAAREEVYLLIRAIQSLPVRCRQVLTLRKIYGLSQKEVALQLGLSENTVESQGSIGLQKCRNYFRRHGYGFLGG